MMALENGVEYLPMATPGDRAAEGRALRKRREALGLTQSQLSTFAEVGLRTLEHIEDGTGGHTRIERVRRVLDRMERGEDPKSTIVRRQLEPGVWITLEVDETVATVRAVRRGEDALRAIGVDGSQGQGQGKS